MKKKIRDVIRLQSIDKLPEPQFVQTVQGPARLAADVAKWYGQAFASLLDANHKPLADTQARNRLRSRLLLDAIRRFGPEIVLTVEAELGRSLELLAAKLLLAQPTGVAR